jgi:sarcosine oxidase gamma subunit
VPELWEVKGAAKIRLFGPKDALDRVQTPAGVNQGRVAPDELLWLGDPEQAGALEAEGKRQLAGAGERALVVDNSDGWALFSIVGDGRADALARLSSLRLPDEGFRQGKVADVPGKVFARAGRIDILCTSDVRWYVRERLLQSGADLGLKAGTAPDGGAVSAEVAR